jgi:hypothetical protein
MTPQEFRRIALGMQGAFESAHMGHPDFRANGRIFATIAPDAKWGMVKLSPDQQAEFVRAEPATFVPAAGAWGRSGCTMVQFATADGETLGEAMTLAWQGTVNVKSKAKPKAAAKPKPKPKPSTKAR